MTKPNRSTAARQQRHVLSRAENADAPPTRVGPSQAIEKSINGSRNWAIFRLIRPFLAPASPR